MTYNLTLTGENPQELANFLTALSQTNGVNAINAGPAPSFPLNGGAAPTAQSFDALAAAKEQIANSDRAFVPAVSGDLSAGAAVATTANGKAVAQKKSAAQKKAAVQKNTEPQQPVTPPDEDAVDDGFSAAVSNASAGDDYDFGLDLGTKTSGWTVEEVREKAKEVVNAGKQLQLRECLNQFGAASISTLEAQHYDGFMALMNKINY